MRETKTPRQLSQPDPKPLPPPPPRQAGDPRSCAPGVKLPEGGMEEREAFEAWLAHVEAGRIG